MQHAVDAQPHERDLALGLEMNIRRALLERIAQDMIQRLDHWAPPPDRAPRSRADRNSWLPRSKPGSRPAESCFSAVFRLVRRLVEALRDRLDVARVATTRSTSRPVTLLMSESGNGASGSWTATVSVVAVFEIATRPCRREKAAESAPVTTSRSSSSGLIFTKAQAGERRQRLGDLDFGGQLHLDDRVHDWRGIRSRVAAYALGVIARQHLAEYQDLKEICGIGSARRGRRFPGDRHEESRL